MNVKDFSDPQVQEILKPQKYESQEPERGLNSPSQLTSNFRGSIRKMRLISNASCKI